MKKFASFLAVIALIFSLCGCETRYKRADEAAKGFISAMLIRDESAMKEYLHPDYIGEALPDDKFYNTLAEQYLDIGHTLDALDSVAKNYIETESESGKFIECGYLARVNELFYNIDLMFLDDGNGFGIISVAVNLNTNAELYD